MRNLLSLTLLALATSVFAQGDPPATDASTTSSTGEGNTAAQSSSVPPSSSATQETGASSTPPPAAASTPAPAPPAGGSPVTSGISAECATYLNQLNTNGELNACLGPMIGASSPGYSNATMVDFCKQPGCSDTIMRSQLTQFGDACQQELTGASPVPLVIGLYDALYTVNPMRDAICSKDGGQYCLSKIPTTQPAVASAVGRLKAEGVVAGSQTLSLPQGQVVISQTPNAAVWRATGVANLLALPDLPAEALCTPCTVAILAAYADFGVAHALGAANSQLVGGQGDLWKAINTKCDASFTKEIFDPKSFAARGNSATAISSGMTNALATVFVVAATVWLSL